MVGDLATTYALTGIRTATTAPQEALLERAMAALRSDERVLAAWLAGSFATGEADAWSDLDVHCCVDDAALDGLRGDGWKAVLARITPTVMATTFPGEVVELYFYFLGNLITVLGRGELLLATNGTIARRDQCLVPLLLAERGIRRAGGQKRLNPFLSPEQRRLLEALPPIMPTMDAPTMDAVVACEAAIARVFLPRGRALAARRGARWPVELEAATIAHVERGLGAKLVIA